MIVNSGAAKSHQPVLVCALSSCARPDSHFDYAEGGLGGCSHTVVSAHRDITGGSGSL